MSVISSDEELRGLDTINGFINYHAAIIAFLICSYSIYFIFGNDFISKLVVEDGFFECLTAVFFLFPRFYFSSLSYPEKTSSCCC